MWHTILAQAQEVAQQTATEPGTEQATPPANPMNSMLLIMVAFLAIIYFFTIRPNQKREKERREMLAALAKGDKVVTSGGICGSIIGVTDKTVVLRVSDDPVVKMEFLRGAITQVTSRAGQDKD